MFPVEIKANKKIREQLQENEDAALFSNRLELGSLLQL